MKKYAEGGIYTAEMGKPPQDIDMGSAPAPKRMAKEGAMMKREGRGMAKADMQKAAPKKYAKGGVTRADGCVTKGHTKGRMV